jgi:hypothetical protein
MAADTIRVYLPYTFIYDARESDPEMGELWDRIEALPTVRRGGGTGVWATLTPEEAAEVRKEAEYRAEYWLTGAYGVEGVTSRERSAGKAAKRVAEALAEGSTQ